MEIKKREPWEPQGIPVDPPEEEAGASPRLRRPWESNEGYAARMQELNDELAAARHEGAPGEEDDEPALWRCDGKHGEKQECADPACYLRKGDQLPPANPVTPVMATHEATASPKPPGKWVPGGRGRPPKNRDQAVITQGHSQPTQSAQGQGDMSKHPKNPTLQEKPIDIIQQVAANGCTEVNVLIKRRNHSGRFEVIQPGVIMQTLDLLNIEAELGRLGGGGNYEIESRNPSNLGEFLIPRFAIVMGGPMRPSPNAMASSVGVSAFQVGGAPGMGGGIPSFAVAGGGPQMTLPPDQMYDQFGRMKPPPNLPPFYQGFPIAQQWELWKTMNPQVSLPTGASMHSDQVAMYSEQNAQREKQAYAAQVAAANAEVRRLTDALAKQTVETAEARHRAEMDGLRAEIRAMATRSAEPPVSPWANIAQIGAALAPFVPVLTAMVQSGKSTQEMMLSQQTNTMNTVLAQITAKKPDSQTMDMIKVMAPLAIPIIVKMLDQREPGAIASANAQTAQAQMALMEFMGDFIEKHKEQAPDEPWWYPMVTQVLGSLQNMMAMKQLQGGGAPQALPSQVQPAAMVQQAIRAVTPQKPTAPVFEVDPRDDSHWTGLMKDDPQAANLTRQVFTALPVEHGLHRHEWKILVFNLHHTKRIPPQEFAEFFADHIEHEVNFGKLPVSLQAILEKPVETLAQLIGVLPIARIDSAYAQQIVEACATEITMRVNEAKKAQEDMEKEVDASSNGEGGVEDAEIVEEGEGEEEVDEGEEDEGDEDGVVVYTGDNKQPEPTA